MGGGGGGLPTEEDDEDEYWSCLGRLVRSLVGVININDMTRSVSEEAKRLPQEVRK